MMLIVSLILAAATSINMLLDIKIFLNVIVNQLPPSSLTISAPQPLQKAKLISTRKVRRNFLPAQRHRSANKSVLVWESCQSSITGSLIRGKKHVSEGCVMKSVQGNNSVQLSLTSSVIAVVPHGYLTQTVGGLGGN